MRAAIAGAVVLLLASGMARADDFERLFIPRIEISSYWWQGPYSGVSSGYAKLKDTDPDSLLAYSDRGQDWVLGAHAGYLMQRNNFVFGAELEALRLAITFEEHFFITIENAYLAKLRAGYAVDRFLFTGHLGAAYATSSINIPGVENLADVGVVAGFGVDWGITDRITLGAQYSHFFFNNFDGSRIDADIDLLTARLSFRF